jgi:uncharacterized membrane protein
MTEQQLAARAKLIAILYIPSAIALLFGMLSGDTIMDWFVAGLLYFISAITAMIAAIMAHNNRKQADGWLKSIFQYLYRTFWLSAFYGFVRQTIITLNWFHHASGEVLNLTQFLNNPTNLNQSLVTTVSSAPAGPISYLSTALLWWLTAFYLLRACSALRALKFQQAISRPKTWLI